jgi:cell envelope opacity-associated protein A
MPGRFELKPTLAKIWHAPDNFRIMDPLPPMHRRGINRNLAEKTAIHLNDIAKLL